MEDILLAAVVVLAVLVLLDLSLTLAVIRRLRQQVAERAGWAGPPLSVPVGSPVPEFRAESTDGAIVTAETLRERRSFVAFVSGTCDACHEQLPQLREHVAAVRASGEHVLVVVGGRQADAGELVAALDGAATVVMEGKGRSISKAFAVDGYPTYVVLDDGAVAGAYPSMRYVPAAAAV